MQTRKKSISLHALGVIPSVPRGAAAHRSTSSSSTPSTPSNSSAADSHPSKRLKRSHTLSSDSGAPPSAATAATSPTAQRRRNVSSAAADKHRNLSQNTPPPSPGDTMSSKLDLAGINDDIVVGVLQQLEATGNRPHLIKELATALSGSIRSVDSSANPVAIISSRLTNYLRRPWTALAPCPLAKEQVNVHPRRVYYFLTTCSRQDIPDYVDPPKSPARIVTPSISSGPEDEDAAAQDSNMDLDIDRRDASPSPELDDFDLPDLNIHASTDSPFGDRSHQPYGTQHSTSFVDSGSTPLENDEREFTQTASFMANRASDDSLQRSQIAEESMIDEAEMESEEVSARRNEEAASMLFGHGAGASRLGINPHPGLAFGSSPMLRPQSNMAGKDGHFKSPSGRKYDELKIVPHYGNDLGAWDDLKSPEAVGLNELDDMLGGF